MSSDDVEMEDILGVRMPMCLQIGAWKLQRLGLK